jgi:ABC-type antimicrobial peptide transport system permease subunit
MNSWLQDFKFHISINPLFFAITVLLMFVIAFITVGYQSIKAALMNPVKAIKTE